MPLPHNTIEELQNRQRSAAATGSQPHPPCDHAADESCVTHAIGNLCQSSLLSYAVKVGIGILIQAFRPARWQSYSSLLDLKIMLKVIMYAFVMRPESLPKSYQEFMQKTGPIAQLVDIALFGCSSRYKFLFSS